MQKFTRPLTREIEVGGTRLAVTFSAEGMEVRIVGTRRPPLTLSWASVLVAGMPQHGQPEPTAEEIAAAVKALGSIKAAKEETPPAAPSTSATTAPTAPQKTEPAPAASRPAGAAPTASLSDLLGRLEIWLSQNRPRFHKGLLPGATPEQLDALEKDLGVPLPAELRTLLAWHNGQDPEVVGGLEHSWILSGTNDIRSAKHNLDSSPPPGWNKAWIPFLDNDADSFVCVDTSQPGHPVRECWAGHSEHPVTAPSLTAWFNEFVTAVERGDYYEDPERGRFLRRV
jgi:cell wall assembly regulator SMI1